MTATTRAGKWMSRGLCIMIDVLCLRSMFVWSCLFATFPGGVLHSRKPRASGGTGTAPGGRSVPKKRGARIRQDPQRYRYCALGSLEGVRGRHGERANALLLQFCVSTVAGGLLTDKETSPVRGSEEIGVGELLLQGEADVRVSAGHDDSTRLVADLADLVGALLASRMLQNKRGSAKHSALIHEQ
jgi:hypothetical protein